LQENSSEEILAAIQELEQILGGIYTNSVDILRCMNATWERFESFTESVSLRGGWGIKGMSRLQFSHEFIKMNPAMLGVDWSTIVTDPTHAIISEGGISSL